MNLSALQHSPFLQSLGWAIANSLWQAAVLWMIYQVVQVSYKNGSSKFKNTLSTCLLFFTFGWFIITFINKYLQFHNSASLVPIPIEHTGYLSYGISFDWGVFIDKISNALPYLSIAYILLLVMLTTRLVNSYLHIFYIKKHGLNKPSVEWRLFTDRVSMHMGITHKITLWFSEHVDVPATIGFIKPFILIPIASINQLTTDQLEAVILHELSHIRRNDYLINLVISIIETILFFNPFVVLLGKILKRERENCCDDFVIQYQYDRHSYASALLSLEQTRSKNIKLAIGATSGKKQLLGRIQRIMEVSSANNINYGQKLLALILITGIICSIAWLSPQKKEHSIKALATGAVSWKPNFPFSGKNVKNGAAPVAITKLQEVKKISNKIAIALEKDKPVVNEKIIGPPDYSSEWDMTGKENAEYAFNERIRKELNKVATQSFKNIQAGELKKKNHLFSTKEPDNFRFFKQFSNADITRLNYDVEKMAHELSAEKMANLQSELAKAFDSSHWKQPLNAIWNIQRKMSTINRNIRTDSLRSNPGGNHNNKRRFAPEPESQYSFEYDNSPKHPTSISISGDRLLKVRARVNGMKIDCRDGLVYVNGKAMTNLTTLTPTFEISNGIVVVSNGTRVLEIHIDTQ